MFRLRHRLTGKAAAFTVAAVMSFTGILSPLNVYAAEDNTEEVITEEVITEEAVVSKNEQAAEGSEITDNSVPTDNESAAETEVVSENEASAEETAVSENETAAEETAVSGNETVSDIETVSGNEAVSENSVSENATDTTVLPETEEAAQGSENGSGSVEFTVEGGITTATLSDGAYGIEAVSDEASHAVSVTISKNGAYDFTGNAVNTTITVNKGIEASLGLSSLTIDDSALASLISKDSPVIEAGKNSVITVKLTGSSEITGSSSFVTEPSAVIKGKDGSSITFTGSGSLSVTDPMSANTDFTVNGEAVDPADAVSAKAGVITVESGTLTLRAVGSALKSKQGTINIKGGTVNVSECHDDAVKAKDGTINITSGTLNLSNIYGDGLKAKMEETSNGGNINVSGGILNINDNIYGDGIQGENVDITGGELNIKTVFANASTGYYTSGSSSLDLNYITEDERSGLKTERINVDIGDHAAIKAGTKASTRKYTDTTITYSASGHLNISGGTLNLDTTGAGLKANSVTTGGYTKCSNGVYIIGSPDDAIKSNNTINISGGNITINASDDAVTSAGDLTVTGSNTVINVQTCFEGFEGKNIIIGTNGPEVTINSNDDGMNAAYKTNVTYTYDCTSSEDYDYGYTKTTTKGSGCVCRIYSGNVTVKIDSASTKSTVLSGKTINYKADGDGIDCNGSLDIEGGTVCVFGSCNTSNSPFDTDSGFTLGANAVILGTGSDGMNESTPENGGGVYLTYGSGGNSGGMPGDQPGGQPGDQPGGPGAPGTMNTTSVSTEETSGAEATANALASEETSAEGFGNGNSVSIAAGSSFKVLSGSTELISTTLPYAATFLIYGSPSLVSGQSYTLNIAGTASTATAVTTGSGSSSPGQPGDPTQPSGPNQPGQPGDPTQPSGPDQPGQPGDPTQPSDPSQPSDPTQPSDPAQPQNPDEQSAAEESTSKVTKINLNAASISLGVGRTCQLKVSSVAPADADPSVTWSSSDTSMATVENGLVKAVSTGASPAKTGTVKITATAADGSNKTAVCTVTVGNAITSINLNNNGGNTSSDKAAEGIKLARGKTLKLKPEFTTTYSSEGITEPMNRTLIWSSSDGSIASVASDGTVNAIRKGTVTITAGTTGYCGNNGEDGEVVETVDLEVTVPPTSAAVTKTVSIEEGRTVDLNGYIAVTPADAGYEAKFTAVDDSYITLTEDGILTSKSAGTEKVSVTITDIDGSAFNKTFSMNIKTVAALTDAQKAKAKLKLNKKKATLGCGAILQLVAKASPAVYDTITWTSSDPSLASVNSTGLVTVNSDQKKGKVVITAKMDDKTASCTITAAPADSGSLSLVTGKYTKLGDNGLAVGKSVRIKAVYSVKPANNKIIWSSEDTGVATVKNGLIKATGEGTTVIKATSADDPRIQKTLTVKTYVPVKKLSLGSKTIKLTKGNTGRIRTIVITPDEATDQALSVTLTSKTKNTSAESIALIAVKKADGTVGSFGTSIASVDYSAGESVVYKGIGKGVVRAAFTSKDGSNKKVLLNIKVTE